MYLEHSSDDFLSQEDTKSSAVGKRHKKWAKELTDSSFLTIEAEGKRVFPELGLLILSGITD